MAEVVIARRFCGPPDSGNGGYVAGVVAGALGGSGCTVTLKRPPPLDRPLQLVREGDTAILRDEAGEIASAIAAVLDLQVPAPPDLAGAAAAEDLFTGHDNHLYPACFVCGPHRAHGDGLRIFPGAVGGQMASTWRPTGDLAGENGLIRREFLWAALDCPGYFAAEQAAGDALLGRMAARVERDVSAGQDLIVTGWAIDSDGRKHHVGTAIHDSAGRLVASARSTWITLGR